MLGGALRGFNLLLVLAGLIVGILITQWRWSRRSLEKLRVDRIFPRDIFAGEVAQVRYRIQNGNYWMPAWMIRIEDVIEARTKSNLGVIATGTPLIEAGGRTVITSDLCFSDRGEYTLPGAKVMTCFPFSLSTAILDCPKAEQVIVFPQLLSLQKHWDQNLRQKSLGNSAKHHQQGSGEGEFFGLREWRNGDNRKWIHWRTSARIGHLAVRQFEDQRKLNVFMIVDAFLDRSDDSDLLESTICLAASVAMGILRTENDHADMICIGQDVELTTGRAGGDSHSRKLLTSLSKLRGNDSPKWHTAFEQLRHQRVRPKQVIVVSTRSRKEFMEENPEANQLLTQWSRTSQLHWTNAKTDLDQWIEPNPLGPDRIEKSGDTTRSPLKNHSHGSDDTSGQQVALTIAQSEPVIHISSGDAIDRNSDAEAEPQS